MDNFLDFMMNHAVLHITRVRESAAKHRGECTWHFSQAKDPVRSVLLKSKETWIGICELLSAKWIAQEIAGTPLRTILAPGDGHRSHLDLAQISLLAQASGTGKSKGGDQEVTTRAWLHAKGIMQRERRDLEGSDNAGAPPLEADDILRPLRNRIATEGDPLTGLLSMGARSRLFNLWKGHVVAFRITNVGAPAVRFFDSNFGEFSFASRAYFESWFRDYFKVYRNSMGSRAVLRYFR